MAQVKDKRIKIDAPIDNIVDLVRQSFGASLPEPSMEDRSINVTTEPPEDVATTQSPYSSIDPNKLQLQKSSLQPNLQQPSLQIPSANFSGFEGPEQPNPSDRLRDLLLNPPTLEGNKPSTLRRIGGAITGGLTGAAFGPEIGVQQAQNITQKPYREAYQDWATRTGALEKLSNLDINQQKVDIDQQRADASGLSSYGSYLRSIGAVDPELQGDITRERVTAEEEVKEPGRQKEAQRKIEHDLILEDVRKIREQGLEQLRQTGRASVNQKTIESQEKRAREAINSRENIARLNRDLRKKLQDERLTATKQQRVPPSQQHLGRLMAEDQIAKTIADPTEFEALFNTIVDSQGRTTISLKPDSEVPAKWKLKYDARKGQITNLMSSILKNSYNPLADEGEEFDIESESENGEDEFEIEEVDN